MQQLTIEQQNIRAKIYQKFAHNYPMMITMVLSTIILAIAEYAIWQDINFLLRVLSCLISSSFLTAFYFLFTRISRRVSKDILENMIIFKSTRKPSTRILLKDDETFSKIKKHRIISKLKNEGCWELDMKIMNSNNKPYINAINNATSHILEVTRHDGILFERNCNYGFARNLFGGLFVDTLISVVIMIVLLCISNVYWQWYIYILIVEIIALLLIAFMAYREGVDYAIRLYDVYLEY